MAYHSKQECSMHAHVHMQIIGASKQKDAQSPMVFVERANHPTRSMSSRTWLVLFLSSDRRSMFSQDVSRADYHHLCSLLCADANALVAYTSLCLRSDE